MKRVAIIGISGKLGRLMAGHALDRGYAVTGLCRPESVDKLGALKDRVTLVSGDTSDEMTIARTVAGVDGVLTVLVPWGVDGMATRTAAAVLAHAEPGARLVFSAGWHIRFSDKDRYPLKDRVLTFGFGLIARLTRMADMEDHRRAARLVFASGRDWTLVRASDLEDGDSEGLPVWSTRVGDPMLASNRTRRTDFALFMVNALTDSRLLRMAPAIVSRASPSARTCRQANCTTPT